jgi:hypothetical protein
MPSKSSRRNQRRNERKANPYILLVLTFLLIAVVAYLKPDVFPDLVMGLPAILRALVK